MGNKKSDYLEYVDEGYYTYCDTRRMNKYEAARKFLDLLYLWSDNVYDEEYDFYYIKIRKKIRININSISEISADRFNVDVTSPEDEGDDEWKISISFSEKDVAGVIQYNNIVFTGDRYQELSIDGLIYTSNFDTSLGGEITLLTSVKL